MNTNDINNLYKKYLGNSFYSLKSAGDIDFFHNILNINNHEENLIKEYLDKLESILKNEEKGIKYFTFRFLVEQLFFIVNRLGDYEIKDELCCIKGNLDDRDEIKEHKRIYEFIISLSLKYEVLHRTNVDNMINIYLNKLINLIELIRK